jgi:ubiquinone biosynthesis protein
MEMLEGIPAANVEALHQSGVDLDDLARRGANVFLQMIFRDGFYHADPHPDNLMMLTGGAIGILDCGMVGRMNDRLRDEIDGLFLAVAQKDAKEVADVVKRLGSVPPHLDREALENDVRNFVEEYGSLSLKDFDLSGALNRMIEIIHQYQIVLPPDCSLLLKTLILLEGTSKGLNPSFSLAELIEPIKSKRSLFRPERWVNKLLRAYREWDRLLEALPRDLTDILRELRGDTLSIRQENPRLVGALNRLAWAIVTAALFLAAGLLWNQEARPVIAGISVPGILTYLAAVLLGFKLALLMRKSGRNFD